MKCTTFLGITIDEHLDWKVHIDNLSNKIARNVGVLNKLKHFLPIYIMKTLYSSLIITLTVLHFIMGKLSCHKCKKIIIITAEGYSYNHIISLYCTHRPTIRNDKTFKIRRSIQISIRHIYAQSYTLPTATKYVINVLTN